MFFMDRLFEIIISRKLSASKAGSVIKVRDSSNKMSKENLSGNVYTKSIKTAES